MATTLSPSGLKTVGAYNVTNWASTYNDNFTLLNNTLLKLSELMDVAKAGVAHGKILMYSEPAGKWVPVEPGKLLSTSRRLKFL